MRWKSSDYRRAAAVAFPHIAEQSRIAWDEGAEMLPAQRRGLILDAIRSGQGVEVVDLAQRFAVSEMTVRRDLTRLAQEGKLTRVHGGAVSEREEPPFAAISQERHSERQRIGRAAAGLVEDGHAVMIDIGTTTLALAHCLHGRKLRVITSNLAVVEELANEPDVELIVLGGVVRRNYRSLVGMLAEDALRQLSADIAFLGASGIREDLSVMDTTLVEVPIKRGMIAASRRTVLLVDAAKFEMTGSIRICGAEELDAVVTDANGDHPGVAALEHAGVEVVRA
jgi:DeoR/GlpR family transcriptional regulator of sugar metabolism